MRTRSFRTGLLATAAFAALGMAPSAWAFDEQKNTVFTVQEPVRVGDVTLAPGTYVIRVVDHGTDLNVLQVTDLDRMKVLAMMQARQRSRLPSEVLSEGTLTFEGAPGGTRLLRKWNLEYRTFGYDVVSSEARAPNAASLVVRTAPLAVASK
jgi:hypothetical protein